MQMIYKSIRIGTQEWMVENLKDGHFKNGDPILEAKTESEWEGAGAKQIPGWCRNCW